MWAVDLNPTRQDILDKTALNVHTTLSPKPGKFRDKEIMQFF